MNLNNSVKIFSIFILFLVIMFSTAVSRWIAALVKSVKSLPHGWRALLKLFSKI